ncbi:MAG TPA: TetR/AcrR family transcriptional regulator [Ktedonobacterales bacterium]|nr:TetR/AcrR family transcriptional regulator [Ktedonobacterales bacterium]
MANADNEPQRTEQAGEQRLYHHGDLRAALIRAGLAILAEEGAQALTLRAVARRAGVSHNAPYRHFADKEALLAAIAEEGFVELTARVEEARAHVPASPRTQLEDSGWAYVQFALAHPDHLRVMFDVPITDPQAYPGLLAAGARAFNVLVEIIEAGQRAGEFIDGDPRQIAFAAWGMVHGLALLLANQQVPRDVRASYGQEELVRLCIRQQHQGLVLHP